MTHLHKKAFDILQRLQVFLRNLQILGRKPFQCLHHLGNHNFAPLLQGLQECRKIESLHREETFAMVVK